MCGIGDDVRTGTADAPEIGQGAAAVRAVTDPPHAWRAQRHSSFRVGFLPYIRMPVR